MTLICGAPPSGRMRARLAPRRDARTRNIPTPVRCWNKMTPESSVDTSFQCSQPLFFSPLVTVNNLGSQTLYGTTLQMLQTNPRFMAKLLEQLGGCAAIKAEFLGASQDAQYKEGIRALISLWQAIQVVFRGLVVNVKPPEATFFFCLFVLVFNPSFYVRGLDTNDPKFIACLFSIQHNDK